MPQPTVTDDMNSSPEPRQFSATTLLAAAGVAAAVLLALVLVFGGNGDSAKEVSTDFRQLDFITESGDTANLDDYIGQPLVVNFFAAWCAPCRRELPDFEEVAAANSDSVKILGVSHDLDETTWRNLVRETEISFETVFQPGSQIHTAVGAQGMPTTIFVSPTGELLDTHTGLMTADALQERIDELFRRSPNG